MRSLFCLVFNVYWVIGLAQVQVTWVAPLATEINLKADSLLIEAIIESSEKMEKADVLILLNGEQLGQKADVVKLGQANEAATKFNFSILIPLVDGENRIKIGIRLSDNSTHYSLTRLFVKSESKITEVVRSHEEGAKGIFWIAPRWQSTPMVVDQRQFKLKAIINSPVALQKKDIYLVRQQIVKTPLAPTAKLKELRPGKYELTTTMQLEGEGIMAVQIKVKTPLGGMLASDPIPLNFSPHRPNIHLLSVGTQTNLNYTIDDAKDFADLFQTQSQEAGGQLFNTVDIQTLTGTAATATAIKAAIERLETKFKHGRIGEKDLVLLYLSSHGFLDDRRQLRIQGDDYDPGAWRTTSVSYERDIMEILEGIPCKKLIFIDACHSGGGEKGDDLEVKYRIEELNKMLQGVTTIVSSSGREISYEDEVWKNGAFTEAIVEGLLHYRADTDHNYLITINELWQYVRTRVPSLVRAVKKKTQHPQLLSNELGDLAIFYVK